MSSSKTRREFLITAGTGVAMGLLPRMGRAQANGNGGAQVYPSASLRVRKNVVSSAAQNDLASLKKGVAAMKQLFRDNPSDPRGWALQAFIHGNCTRFTLCQHGNWFFPPWHRSFIYYYEQLIQFFSGDPNFALPYWDWSRTHSVPGSFYGSGNPLDDDISLRPQCGSSAPTAGRGRSATDQFSQADLDTYVGPVVISRILQNPDYATFGGGSPGTGQLEGLPHNFVHRWVGGPKYSNMVQTYSPMDPIFWLHHCNIDRLYSAWIVRHPGKTPGQSAWRDKSFNDFYDSRGNRVGSQFTCAMTVDSRVMGYDYDQVLQMPAALLEETRDAAGRQEVVGSVAASRGTVRNGVLSFVTDAPPPAPTRQLMNAAAVGVGNHTVRLRIEGVDVPERQNTGVHVFLGPNVTAETPITAPGYVGSFTFFEGHGEGEGGGEHQHGSRTLLLNASEALRQLYGDISLPEGENLSVSILTRPLYADADAFARVEELQPDKVQFDVVDLDA